MYGSTNFERNKKPRKMRDEFTRRDDSKRDKRKADYKENRQNKREKDWS